jgi:hypothetical protein
MCDTGTTLTHVEFLATNLRRKEFLYKTMINVSMRDLAKSPCKRLTENEIHATKLIWEHNAATDMVCEAGMVAKAVFKKLLKVVLV